MPVESTPNLNLTPQENRDANDVNHPTTSDDRTVPVTEAIRYRKRAQQAEHELAESRESFDTLADQLKTAQQTIEQLERRQRIDALLSDADAIDLDAARLLTEQAVLHMDAPDVALAVDDLRRHKPWLFRRHASPSAMAPRYDDALDSPAADAAARAATTGQRRDLLDYLRLRRQS